MVLFLAGQWETQDLLIDGRWTNILQPSFRRYELHQLRTLVAVATAHGAHLDLLTEPAMEAHGEYENTGVMDLGPPNPASVPRRRDLYNGLLLRTAAAFPGRVSVLDYGQLLSPHGTFAEYLDGVQVRATDGVHTPAYLAGFPLFSRHHPHRGRGLLPLALPPDMAGHHRHGPPRPLDADGPTATEAVGRPAAGRANVGDRSGAAAPAGALGALPIADLPPRTPRAPGDARAGQASPAPASAGRGSNSRANEFTQ